MSAMGRGYLASVGQCSLCRGKSINQSQLVLANVRHKKGPTLGKA